MLSFGKGQKPVSHLTLILSTIVVASLLFIASRMLSIKTRQEALSAMKADALSGGVSELPAGNVIPASAGEREYANYFIEMQ
jgi:hypothetical protein